MEGLLPSAFLFCAFGSWDGAFTKYTFLSLTSFLRFLRLPLHLYDTPIGCYCVTTEIEKFFSFFFRRLQNVAVSFFVSKFERKKGQEMHSAFPLKSWKHPRVFYASQTVSLHLCRDYRH